MRTTPDTPSAQARALVAAGATLLDVRTREEFAAGHLDGAKNLPVQELAGRMAELGPTSTPLVVYCHAGMRSRAAVQMLQRAGYTAVFDLGPMAAW